MADLSLFEVNEAVKQPDRPDRSDESVANMDETDWMAMMMEMRIISA